MLVLLLFAVVLFPGHPFAMAGSPKYPPSISAQDSTLQEDLHLLKLFSKELEALERQMLEMQRSFGVGERGYFVSSEHDQIENLLFRYRAIRASLWSMVYRYYDTMEEIAESDQQTRGFLIGYNAALNLAHYSSMLVGTFIDDRQVIGKLNEPYHRLEIPPGSYDEFFKLLTSVRNIQALKAAWELFSDELEDRTSPLYALQQADPEYAAVIESIGRLHASAEKQILYILKKRSLLSPEIENMLRQTVITTLARESLKVFGKSLYAIRGLLYSTVSDIKSPLAANMRFSTQQVARIRSMLQPGDIILTFSSGYMSNIFLPGKFKHGITYVGSPEQRHKLGLSGYAFRGIPDSKRKKLEHDLNRSALVSGHHADLIEAVAEGVVFNSLDKILDHHLGRILVLRPRISPEELRKELATVFLLLGDDYDFSFDFDNGARQCCTEVLYRALNGCDNIRFSLLPRLGVQTLSADDIVHHYLRDEGRSFEFVLLATRGQKGHAEIYTGNKGEAELARLMKAVEPETEVPVSATESPSTAMP